MDQLRRDPELQQYLHYIDQLAPHGDLGHTAGSSDADVELAAQQRLSRISRDIQRRVKRDDDDETAFRFDTRLNQSSIHSFNPLTPAVAILCKQARTIIGSKSNYSHCSGNRKTATESAEVTRSGRLFQTRAVATGKARSPTVGSRVRLTINDEDELEWSR